MIRMKIKLADQKHENIPGKTIAQNLTDAGKPGQYIGKSKWTGQDNRAQVHETRNHNKTQESRNRELCLARQLWAKPEVHSDW